jgi:hypothetical protein
VQVHLDRGIHLLARHPADALGKFNILERDLADARIQNMIHIAEPELTQYFPPATLARARPLGLTDKKPAKAPKLPPGASTFTMRQR